MSKINDAQKRAWLKKCSRTDINRWLWVRVQGAPFERGFQYGSLTAKEYAEAVRVYAAMTIETAGKDLAFFRDKAVELQIYPELLDLFILAAMWKRSRICRARGHSGEPESASGHCSAGQARRWRSYPTKRRPSGPSPGGQDQRRD